MRLLHLMSIASQKSTTLAFSAATQLAATRSEELLESRYRKWRESVILVIRAPSQQTRTRAEFSRRGKIISPKTSDMMDSGRGSIIQVDQELEKGEIKESQANKEKRQAISRCINSGHGIKIVLEVVPVGTRAARARCSLPTCQHGYEDGQFIVKFVSRMAKEQGKIEYFHLYCFETLVDFSEAKPRSLLCFDDSKPMTRPKDHRLDIGSCMIVCGWKKLCVNSAPPELPRWSILDYLPVLNVSTVPYRHTLSEALQKWKGEMELATTDKAEWSYLQQKKYESLGRLAARRLQEIETFLELMET